MCRQGAKPAQRLTGGLQTGRMNFERSFEIDGRGVAWALGP